MSDAPLSAHARIEVMKARQAEQLRREQEERHRREDVRKLPSMMIGSLAASVGECDGLQLRKDGNVGRCAVVNYQPNHLSNFRPALRIEFQYGSKIEVLIRFVVEGDFGTGDLYLTHDDDRVTHDQAVDLALSVVEKYLYDEKNNAPPDASDVPF